MEFKVEQRQKRRRKLNPTLEQASYSQWLQFYRTPPIETISLQELEELAMSRLKVLKAVETVGVRCVRGGQEHREALEIELRRLAKEGVMKGLIPRVTTDYVFALAETRSRLQRSNAIYRLEDSVVFFDDDEAESAEERRRDHLSHFILRLAYCKTEDLRRWFIAQESDLFRYRFARQSSKSAQEFLAFNGLHYAPISKEEKKELHEELFHSRPNFTEAELETTEFYKVRFTDALELVRSVRVYVRRGCAYVPHSDLVIIVLSVFRSALSHDLVIACRHLPSLDEEERLLPLFADISRQGAGGQEYGAAKNNSGSVTADQVDSLAQTAFPLCMQQLHQSLRATHKLKYFGRMQYGLFLKGIGLSLDEALRFWRTEFTRTMDPDKFEKQYAYNIRHSFGKEGKRADYTPYPCMKIIMGNPPGTGDFHGCPYRHADAPILKQRLQALRISSSGTEEIVELAKQGHYQLACGRCFEVRNNVEYKFTPQHPNEYFDHSVKHKDNKPGEGNSNAGVKAIIVKPSQLHSKPIGGSDIQSEADTRMDEFDDDLAMEDIDRAYEGQVGMATSVEDSATMDA